MSRASQTPRPDSESKPAESKPGRAARSRSREVALQVLYAADLSDRHGSDAPAIQDVFENVAQNFELPGGARSFAIELVFGTARHREPIDALLTHHATNWKISRMAAVDRNILRIAAYELLETQTPVSVALDEAIVLARRFGGDSSPGFVNGVLDAVARQLRGATPARGAAPASRADEAV